MKFVMFLLVSTAMLAINALCQEVIDAQVSDTNLATKAGDAVKPADASSHTRSTKQRGAHCSCAGKIKAGKVCPCKKPNPINGLTREEKALCVKKGMKTFQKCKALIMQNKEKKETKAISIPV